MEQVDGVLAPETIGCSRKKLMERIQVYVLCVSHLCLCRQAEVIVCKFKQIQQIYKWTKNESDGQSCSGGKEMPLLSSIPGLNSK